MLGCAYARAGRRRDAGELANGPVDPLYQAEIFIPCDRERAIQALVRAIPEGPFRIGRELEAPEFALLRGDPRVKTLRKKVGLPE